ncbi:MAG: hypothetical protein JWP14_3249, partial [Frankiales bacterium]|nr:hypothetical protein [Frankiales bacterium]
PARHRERVRSPVREQSHPGQQRQDQPSSAQPRRRPASQRRPLRIVFVRLGRDQRTRDYVAKRTAEGKSKAEIMRCLKRYVTREVYAALPREALG